MPATVFPAPTYNLQPVSAEQGTKLSIGQHVSSMSFSAKPWTNPRIDCSCAFDSQEH